MNRSFNPLLAIPESMATIPQKKLCVGLPAPQGALMNGVVARYRALIEAGQIEADPGAAGARRKAR